MPENALPLLQVKDLQRLSLGPLDLELAAGDIVALTGPSGAGKSLILRAIADLDPNAGTYRLAGENRDDMSAPRWRQQVMVVPAHSGWWADKVEPHFIGANREFSVEILHKLGLESSALGWEVAHLSTGERQRLSLARALVLKPKVLLLDEPTSGLDTDNAAKAEGLILAHAKAGGGVIFVTHDAHQATRIATRQIKLEAGKLLEVSS